ncbi:hypothetical protein DIPPA_17800 [Diplonema papillatum]|nr:hypothetical protein DIPPA_17800 [Diplonema papillatum]
MCSGSRYRTGSACIWFVVATAMSLDAVDAVYVTVELDTLEALGDTAFNADNWRSAAAKLLLVDVSSVTVVWVAHVTPKLNVAFKNCTGSCSLANDGLSAEQLNTEFLWKVACCPKKCTGTSSVDDDSFCVPLGIKTALQCADLQLPDLCETNVACAFQPKTTTTAEGCVGAGEVVDDTDDDTPQWLVLASVVGFFVVLILLCVILLCLSPSSHPDDISSKLSSPRTMPKSPPAAPRSPQKQPQKPLRKQPEQEPKKEPEKRPETQPKKEPQEKVVSEPKLEPTPAPDKAPSSSGTAEAMVSKKELKQPVTVSGPAGDDQPNMVPFSNFPSVKVVLNPLDPEAPNGIYSAGWDPLLPGGPSVMPPLPSDEPLFQNQMPAPPSPRTGAIVRLPSETAATGIGYQPFYSPEDSPTATPSRSQGAQSQGWV